jgi:hypothetical protein
VDEISRLLTSLEAIYIWDSDGGAQLQEMGK